MAYVVVCNIAHSFPSVPKFKKEFFVCTFVVDSGCWQAMTKPTNQVDVRY